MSPEHPEGERAVEADAPHGRRIPGRRGLVLAAVLIVLLGGSGSVWWIASQARTPGQRAAHAAPPPPSRITGTVSDQQLVERMELSGKVETASRTTVTGARPQGADRAVVTALPAPAGRALTAGAVVAEVSGRPVLLLPGRFPAYRDLRAGDKGPDVTQLQRALKPLYGTPVNGSYGPSTADAVRRLYAAAGYEAPAARTGGGAPAAGTAGPAPGGQAARPRNGAETDGGTGSPPAGNTGTGPAPAAGTAAPGELLPAAEITYVGALPATVVRVTAAVGDPADKPLLVLGSGGRQVRAVLTADQRTRLRDLPDDAVIRFGGGPYQGGAGTLGSLGGGSEAKPAEQQAGGKGGPEGASGGAGTAAADAAAERPEALFVPQGKEAQEGAAQQITVELRRSPGGALTVPVAAVWTDLGGASTVTVTEGGRDRDVPVEVLFTHEGLTAVRAPEGNLGAGQTVLLVRRGTPGESGGGGAGD